MHDISATVIDPLSLRVARIRHGLRQRDIAVPVGVAPQRISDFENGLRFPTQGQTAILTQILGDGIFQTGGEGA